MPRQSMVREQIEAASGPGLVDEISRWNDLGVDSMSTYGVPVSDRELELQAETYELLRLETIDE